MGRLPARLQARLLRQGCWKFVALSLIGWKCVGEITAPQLRPQALDGGEGPQAMVFCCGIGDFLYGLDAIARWVALARSENRVCIAAVFEGATRANNPTVAELLRTMGWFDQVIMLDGAPGPDWWVPATAEQLAKARLPTTTQVFRYRPYVGGSRWDEVAYQLGVAAGPTEERHALLAAPPGAAGRQLLDRLHDGPRPILVHMRSRSMGYTAPYGAAIANRLLERGCQPVVLDPEGEVPPGALALRVGSLPLLDMVRVVSQAQMEVVALQSLCWPFAWLANVPLLGFHSTLFPDVDAFLWPQMTLVSPLKPLNSNISLVRHAELGLNYDLSAKPSELIEYRVSFVLAELEQWLSKTADLSAV
jgi:hypothetical protein